jgi:hypothetical protein
MDFAVAASSNDSPSSRHRCTDPIESQAFHLLDLEGTMPSSTCKLKFPLAISVQFEEHCSARGFQDIAQVIFPGGGKPPFIEAWSIRCPFSAGIDGFQSKKPRLSNA